MTKLKNSKYDKTKKNQIVTNLKNSNCDKFINYDKSQFMTKDTLEWSFSKIILTSWAAFRDSRDVFWLPSF